MAFRTNKVPAIEERTISGSSVSFNSAFALPLKKCVVSFMATQSGSGTPSPTNRLPINLTEYAYVNANGINKNIPLYNSYCKGILDATNGIIEEQYFRIAISPNDILQNNNYPNVYAVNMGSSISSEVSSVFMANEYEATEHTGASSMANYTIDGYAGTFNGVQGRYIKWKDERFSNLSDMKNWITDNPLICIVKRSTFQYVSIQPYLDLITQIGNNTFSTDTGTLEITFSDLQEKSASGAVASFNTALAMPLVKCEVSFMATQSGSGTPSPDNIRPIVPVSAVDAIFNGTAISKVLGADYGGGNIDIISGVGIENYKYLKIKDLTWYKSIQGGQSGFRTEGVCDGDVSQQVYQNTCCAETYMNNSQGYYASPARTPDLTVIFRSGYWDVFSRIYIRDDRFSNVDEFIANMGEYHLLFIPKNKTIITTPPTQLSTIVGNNTISSTGDIDLAYKDLDIAKRGNFREVFRLPS